MLNAQEYIQSKQLSWASRVCLPLSKACLAKAYTIKIT